MKKAPRSSHLALQLLFLCASSSAAGATSSAPFPQGDAGHEIGFEERFALASDRAATLEELIPGTPEFYYYTCLHLQNLGKLREVPELMETWRTRHGDNTARYREIKQRQMLLGFNDDPARTYRELARELRLSFDHQREVAGKISPLPSVLDPELISLATWRQRAFSNNQDSLGNFGPSQWESLAQEDLNWRQLRAFLEKLERPDVANLASLIVRDLEHKTSRGFGSLAIHKRLLQSQLDQCLGLRPQLLNETAFIEVYLQRLLPNADSSWKEDAGVRLAYIDRLEQFAERLSPANNSLKSHVLEHRLTHNLAEGVWDRERFLKFLRIPRRAGYERPEYLRSYPSAEVAENTGLKPLGEAGDPTRLVQTYLEHFFLTENSWDAFQEFVQVDFLRRTFAETKILAGIGDRERWYSLLNDTNAYERLEQRVEIQFAPTSQTHYAEGQAVRLDVDVKNVDTLLVKVFEIDATSFARAMGHEVNASIDLDGLVAGSETTYSYDAPALRRVRRHFEFPELQKPGVYVIDFIGGGLSSRSVIKIGQLRLRQRQGSAGHVFLVLDENGRVQKQATLRLGSQLYGADEDGEIHVPYTTDPGSKLLIIESGPRVAVERFQHLEESYALQVGVHVERETLLAGSIAPLLLRAELRVNGHPAALTLLENPVLTLRATDVHGTETSTDIRDIELTSAAEFLHEFRVPEDLVRLQVGLRGEVQNLSRGETQTLQQSSAEFWLNRIDGTPGTDAPLLGRDAAGYFVDVLGKNGEPIADRVVEFSFRHEGFRNDKEVHLKSDAAGRIRLGELPGVQLLTISGSPVSVGGWDLKGARQTLPAELHGTQGETLRVPYLGRRSGVTRSDVSLLELRGGEFHGDRFNHVFWTPGYLELRSLPPGDYDLFLKDSRTSLPVRVTAGEERNGWRLGEHRSLESGPQPLHLLSCEWVADGLQLELDQASPTTRVHVFSTRFAPAYDGFQSLLPERAQNLGVAEILAAVSTFDSGRQIGDEYRYILERRFAKKYPGNMLAKPGLLLNPWATRDSVNSLGMGGGAGGAFGGRKSLGARGGKERRESESEYRGTHPGQVPNLDFLRAPGVVLANLRPDANGKLLIPAADLGAGQQIRVLVSDTEDLIEVQVAREERPLERRDRRIRGALAADSHFSEQRRISELNSGDGTTMRDSASARAATFGSLRDVFQLYRTLSPSSELEDFAFLMDWPTLTAEEQQALYSKHACHELHMFLYQKDREFFERVLRPYLVNKAEKTFLDRWLLEEDLRDYLEPWAFGRLNAFEKALLAQRMQALATSVPELLRDRVQLNPPDARALDSLYRVALSAGAMDSSRAGLQLGEVAKYEPPKALSAEDMEQIVASSRTPFVVPGEPILEDAPMPETATGSDDFFLGRGTKATNKDADKRLRQQPLFLALAKTRQYAEHNYYHQPIHAQVAELIEANSFWLDYALAGNAGTPFLSPHFAEATGNVAEMVMALAVLDLPFEAMEHGTERSNGQVQLTAASPMILVRKELAPAAESTTPQHLLVGQQYFPLVERYLQVDGRPKERLIEAEFLRGVAYGCRVVVTNPTAEPIPFELLLQIPAGSIPLNGGFRTKGAPLELGAYSTHTEEYAFYFPKAGQWSHFPAHATQEESWLAAAEGKHLNVVNEPTTRDRTTWEYLSQEAELSEVLEALRTRNLYRLDLNRIAWRMRERAAFDAVLQVLASKHAYDETLWSYALYHRELDAARQYLRNHSGFTLAAGAWLKSPLLDIDPIERHHFERLEFAPLVRERAHPQGAVHKIYNDAHARQYTSLMNILAHKPDLDAKDWMSVTYHFLLQGRIEEALASFAEVDAGELDLKVQYDYMHAYLDFFDEEHALARGIAEGYADYPVPYWQARFQTVLRHMDEAEGIGAGSPGTDEAADRNDRLASAEPTLGIDSVKGGLRLQHSNLDSVELRFYVMDVEFLFSTSPFVQENAGSFNFVLPNATQQLALVRKQGVTDVAIPAQFQNANLLIEARSAGLVARCAYYSGSMGVQWMENYGQLKVTGTADGKPLPKVYVKVFRRTAGRVEFHKDGYTDLRGRFDYVSVSGVEDRGIERYAVLVYDETHGAVIGELDPPQQ